MLIKVLRSIFAPSRGVTPAAAVAAPTNPSKTPDAGQDDSIVRRLDEIQELLAHLDMGAALRYQIDAARLLQSVLADSRYDEPRRLERHGRSVYSQNEEDGILAEIFRRIGTTNRRFLEFGVGDGLQNNTRCLLEQGWSGAWLEGDTEALAAIQGGFRSAIDGGRLAVRFAIIDRDNINDLILACKLPREVDLLSIDIDGNDFFVWEAITVIEPRVVVIEYNSKFPPPMRWTIRYDPAHRWDGSDQFGASLQSLADLGMRKGYRLVGCNITGTNAFFVRSDQAGDHFVDPPDAATLYQPSRYYLCSSFISGHPAGYSRGQNP